MLPDELNPAPPQFAKLITWWHDRARPVGHTAAEASKRRSRRSAEYRQELARLQPYEEIARQVIGLRMSHGLSQEALAQRVGTTKSAISRLESGQHAPTVATLQKIASAFDGRLVISFDVPDQPAREPATALAGRDVDLTVV